MQTRTRHRLSREQIRCIHMWMNRSEWCAVCAVTKQAWMSYVKVMGRTCNHSWNIENRMTLDSTTNRVSGRCTKCFIPFTAREETHTGKLTSINSMMFGENITPRPPSMAERDELPEIEITEPPGEVNEVASRYIPSGTPQIIGMDVETECIALTMETGVPTILIGHTGIAKTLLIKKLHEEAQWPYHTITGHAQVEVDTLVGKIWVEGGTMRFKPGVLIFCMKEGIAIGFQEINAVAPEVLIMLHEYLDEGHVTLTDLPADHEDFMVRPHPNFRLFGTMNPPDLYPGIRELSPALQRRCLVRRVEVLEAESEKLVILAQVPDIGEDLARKMVQTANGMRKNLNEHKTNFFLSTADLVMWAKTADRVGDVHKAAEICIFGKAPREDEQLLRTVIRATIGLDGRTMPVPAEEVAF